jgi:hypothetical protein
MHKIGGEFVQRATEGWIEVEMDDGSVVQVQKTSMSVFRRQASDHLPGH